MTQTAHDRRLIAYAALVRDVLATMGDAPGRAWLRERQGLTKSALAALQREWEWQKEHLGEGDDDEE